jgi:hypothetical protein
MKFATAEKIASDFSRNQTRKLNNAKGLNKKTKSPKKKINPENFLPDSIK